MSINNSSIIKHIAQKNSISPTTVKKILQSYEDYIESHLINNNTIKVLDVGSLRIEKKNKRVVSQSWANRKIEIPEGKKIVFYISSKYKKIAKKIK